MKGADLDRPAGRQHSLVQAWRARGASASRLGRRRARAHQGVDALFGRWRARASSAQPLAQALAHLAGRLAGEGDGQDLCGCAPRAGRAGCATPGSRSCRSRRRPRRRRCGRVAGGRIERYRAGRRRCEGGRVIVARWPRQWRHRRRRPVVAPAQAARVAVFAGRPSPRAARPHRRAADAGRRPRLRPAAGRRRNRSRRHARASRGPCVESSARYIDEGALERQVALGSHEGGVEGQLGVLERVELQRLLELAGAAGLVVDQLEPGPALPSSDVDPIDPAFCSSMPAHSSGGIALQVSASPSGPGRAAGSRSMQPGDVARH